MTPKEGTPSKLLSAQSTAMIILIGLLGVGMFSFYAWFRSLDRRGTYHNTASPADLDGDGDLDVALHNLRQESETTAFGWTTLWINQGGGRFITGPVEVPQLPPYLYLAAAAGDLDLDGDADLMFLSPYQLTIALNQGGAFRTQDAIHLSGNTGYPGSPGGLVLGELDGDGFPDAFVPGCCGMTWEPQPGVESYIPPMSWTWASQWVSGGWPDRPARQLEGLDGLPIRGAALGDLDGDGDLDVYAAVQAPRAGKDTDPADRVLLNDGAGQLADSGQRLGASEGNSVALGDLDADGDLDALVGANEGALAWINQGGAQAGRVGTFAPGAPDFGAAEVAAVFLADLDGDGDPDALLGGTRAAEIWWNDGLGRFSRSGQRFRYSERHGLAVADFDGDGWPDIFAGEYEQNYRLWVNQGDGTFRAAGGR